MNIDHDESEKIMINDSARVRPTSQQLGVGIIRGFNRSIRKPMEGNEAPNDPNKMKLISLPNQANRIVIPYAKGPFDSSRILTELKEVSESPSKNATALSSFRKSQLKNQDLIKNRKA